METVYFWDKVAYYHVAAIVVPAAFTAYFPYRLTFFRSTLKIVYLSTVIGSRLCNLGIKRSAANDKLGKDNREP